MTRKRIDAIEMTRGIRDENHERLRGLSRAERLAYYKEQARLMNEKAATLAITRAHSSEQGQPAYRGDGGRGESVAHTDYKGETVHSSARRSISPRSVCIIQTHLRPNDQVPDGQDVIN